MRWVNSLEFFIPFGKCCQFYGSVTVFPPSLSPFLNLLPLFTSFLTSFSLAPYLPVFSFPYFMLIVYSIGGDTGDPLQYSYLENPMDGGAWWAAVHGVARSRTRLSDFTFTFHFQALEKEMATHSSVLAWRIPGTGEPGGLPSMGSHRVRHDWSDLAAAAAAVWSFRGSFEIRKESWRVCGPS